MFIYACAGTTCVLAMIIPPCVCGGETAGEKKHRRRMMDKNKEEGNKATKARRCPNSVPIDSTVWVLISQFNWCIHALDEVHCTAAHAR